MLNFSISQILYAINNQTIRPNKIYLNIPYNYKRFPEKHISEHDLKHINRENLDNYVHVANYVPEEDLYTYFKNSDAFIAPLRNTLQDRARSPSKLFMYMHFNKPIIITSL